MTISNQPIIRKSYKNKIKINWLNKKHRTILKPSHINNKKIKTGETHEQRR